MNIVSRTISGLIVLFFGALILYGTFEGSETTWDLVWGYGMGVLFCGVAIYLFLNTKEDEIEQITDKQEHHE